MQKVHARGRDGGGGGGTAALTAFDDQQNGRLIAYRPAQNV